MLNLKKLLGSLEWEDLIHVDMILGALPPLVLNQSSEMLLIVLLEAHVHVKVLPGVLLEIKETCRVLLIRMISVTKVVKVISILLLNKINLGLVVLVLVVVELASSVLKDVGLRSFGSKAHDLIDTAFSIGAGDVIHVEQELVDTNELSSGVGNQVLVSSNVDRVLALLVAMAHHNLEVLAH